MGHTSIVHTEVKGRQKYESREIGRQRMAKRQRSEERGCPGIAKRPAPERKKHLYLLLDDWERGYSVRRMDVDDFNSDDDA